ncbi:MAG: AAA family ATPase [Ruminococcus sp.]|nr:AAA family ATPase [Ruminococcus sp.]
MVLKKVYIKGFRNFKEATINFEKQTLVIGANDIGKTNLMYALRILLDRNFSDSHYMLDESDFCV